MAEWIEYSKRKPKAFGKYLCLSNNGNISCKFYSKTAADATIIGDGFARRKGDVYLLSSVAYWMELPEFPPDFVIDSQMTAAKYNAQITALENRIKQLEKELKP